MISNYVHRSRRNSVPKLSLLVIEGILIITLTLLILLLISIIFPPIREDQTQPLFLSSSAISQETSIAISSTSATPRLTLDPPRYIIRRCPEDFTVPLPSDQHQFCQHQTSFETIAFDHNTQSFLLNNQDFREICQTTSTLLSKEDQRRYQQIFTLQQEGNWTQADQLIDDLQDRRLLGHVLFQRYIDPTSYRSSFEELALWLDQYADHPRAEEIHHLASMNKPTDAPELTSPEGRSSQLFDGQEWRALVSGIARHRLEGYSSGWRTRSYRRLKNRIRRSLNQHGIEPTLTLLNAMSDTLSDIVYDDLRSYIATYAYYTGHLRTAFQLAQASIQRSGIWLPNAYWISGLVSWRYENFTDAAFFFTTMANETRSLTPWQLSAALFWAGRTALRLGRPEEAYQWFERASRFQRTFYGLIALYIVNQEDSFYWHIPAFTSQHMSALDRIPSSRRALALLQLGQFELAEAELLRINPEKDPTLTDALIVLAIQSQLPRLATQLGRAFAYDRGTPYDAALYPIASWVPHDDYSINHSLLYALIRQESRFNTQAISSNGAIGLMQLLPTTARSMSDNSQTFEGQNYISLFDPHLNITLGQRYISYLLDHPAVNDNLLMLIAAYNGGVGNLRRWQQQLNSIDDPLLFLESISYRETRIFITKVFANYWIYRLRFKQEQPSLHEIANGQWPSYHSTHISHILHHQESTTAVQGRTSCDE